MDLESSLKSVEAHNREPADLLSQARQYCSALQVFQPDTVDDNGSSSMLQKADKANLTPDRDAAVKPSMPIWKSEDVKSWIRLQQAIHPEVDYERCIRKKWKTSPWTMISLKRWIKEVRQKRKEHERLQRAEVHAAMSVAGVAAALAAVTAGNAKFNQSLSPSSSSSSRESAVASAAALVAAQCAKAAEVVGARREQLEATVKAAMAATDAGEILTLTAAAATSLRGAATLRGRAMNEQKANREILGLPHKESEIDFEKYRTILAKGTELLVETPDGACRARVLYVALNKAANVILKIKKPHMFIPFASAKESVVYNCYGAEDRDPDEETSFNYLIIMTTSCGVIKIRTKDRACYKMWTMVTNHMLMLSNSFSKSNIP